MRAGKYSGPAGTSLWAVGREEGGVTVDEGAGPGRGRGGTVDCAWITRRILPPNGPSK